MLATNCPTASCCTPLMRNKQGQMFCVNCNRYAVTAEQAKQQQEESEKKEAERQQLEAAKTAAGELAQHQKEREEYLHQQFALQAQQKQQSTVSPTINGSSA